MSTVTQQVGPAGTAGPTRPLSERRPFGDRTFQIITLAAGLLVLVILNVLILGMITYLVKGRAEFMQQERADILQALHNCINQK